MPVIAFRTRPDPLRPVTQRDTMPQLGDTQVGATMAAAAAMIGLFSAWQAGRAFSSNTIRRREVSLRTFARYIRPVDLADASPALIEDWLATFPQPSTRRAYRSDVTAFYSWAFKRDLVPANPAAKTDSIKVPKGLPRPVPPEHVPAIIACAPDENVRLIIALAAYAGLRRAEIAKLHVDDVAFYPQPLLIVRSGKGSKDRTVPIADSLYVLLESHRRGRYVPLSADRVGKLGAAHLRACGFDCTLHQLRHSFGTEMYRITKDLKVVGKLMGHESTATTELYAALVDDSSAAAINMAYKPTPQLEDPSRVTPAA